MYCLSYATRYIIKIILFFYIDILIKKYYNKYKIKKGHYMSIYSPNFKKMADEFIVNYLSDAFFNGNRDIAETIQDYNEGLSIAYLTENMLTNAQSNQTEKFIFYIFKKFNTFIPGIEINDCRNPLKLRNLILISKEKKWDSFEIPDWHTLERSLEPFRIHPMKNITTLMLIQCNRSHPINQVDPITLEEVHPRDRFVSDRGERFSLISLIEFHNTRLYRGGIGEQHNSKFVLNPLSNKPFPLNETLAIIQWSIRLNKPLTALHRQRITPLVLPDEEAQAILNLTSRSLWDYNNEETQSWIDKMEGTYGPQMQMFLENIITTWRML